MGQLLNGWVAELLTIFKFFWLPHLYHEYLYRGGGLEVVGSHKVARGQSCQKFKWSNGINWCHFELHVYSDIARPRNIKVYALPSTSLALPIPESHYSASNYTRKQINYLSYNASISVCIQYIIVNLSTNTLQLTKYIRPLSAYKIYYNTIAHKVQI